jgi:hypothetical protein
MSGHLHGIGKAEAAPMTRPASITAPHIALFRKNGIIDNGLKSRIFVEFADLLLTEVDLKPVARGTRPHRMK